MSKLPWLLLALPVVCAAAAPPADDLGDQLLAATRKSDVALMKQLLDKGADVNAKTRYDSTPLFFACDRGSLEAVKLLVERGAKLDVHDNFYNATALGWALNKKHQTIVEFLVEKGADPADPLQESIQSNDAKLFDFVLAKGKLSPDVLNDALQIAVVAKREEMAKALEAKGARKIEYAVDEAVLQSYAGKYADGDMVFNFGVKTDKLTFTQGNGTVVNLVAIEKDKFRFVQAGLEFIFGRDAAGAVNAVSFTGRGGVTTLKKAVSK